jgi:hypothetical protein|tara:strand:+ start:355 stop:999 length:645 start_codon:yes stop_codon:yes gene_type:complete
MTTIPNTMDIDKRFAQHQGHEYHVFSSSKNDPTGVNKWVGLSKPKWVLMDPETYFSIRNQRIEWVLDDEGTLQAVKILDTSGETKRGKPPPAETVTEEIEEEEPSGPVVEEQPPGSGLSAPTPTPDVAEEIEEETSLPELVYRKGNKPPTSVPIKTPELVPKPAPIPMTTPDLVPANTPEIVPAIAPRSTVVAMPGIVDAARAAVTTSMCELKL